MAHHKSALKRIRQNRKRRLYNRANKRIAKDIVKEIRRAKTYEEASELLKKAYKIFDRIAARNVIHKNNAANKKSKLARLVNKLKVSHS
ncbi:MAG: 30S ribosomal protein S20 [Ignavibacteria bacterium]|nr:30S ribosomal protein S20 [Ignavibacteria bacterium]